MLRIAFCDDETEILEELESLTEQYCADRGCRMEYQAFHSPLELLAAMEKGTYFDAVFLDVLMPGENGISTARELRQTDQNIKIVFLTTSSEYAVDSYSVGAYFYQMKPLKKEIYSGLLDSLRAVCEKEQKKSLVVRTRNGITQISFDDLQYCEVRGRNLLYYLGNGTVLEGNGRMERLEACGIWKLYSDSSFVSGKYGMYLQHFLPLCCYEKWNRNTGSARKIYRNPESVSRIRI